MRVESIRVRGLGAFKREFSVDLSGTTGLVAVTGANGAGKSTLLELALPGAMYRQTPTRGSLADLATARDACLDVTLVNGSTWTMRHLVDSVSKKSEALLLKDGVPVPEVQSAKVRDFDDFAASHFPSPEVLLSTVFAAQGTGGFLTAKPAERKSILLKVLGVERLERLAEQARERLKAAKASLETAAARLADERQRGGDAVLLEERLEVFRSAQTQAEGHVVTAQELVDAAVEQVQRIELIQQSNAATLRTRADIDARIDEARAKLPDLEERIKNNRAVLDQANSIRQAVEATDDWKADLAKLQAEIASAESAAQAALAPWLDVNERTTAAQQRLDQALANLKDRVAVETAALELPSLRDAVEEAQADLKRIDAELEELGNTRLAGAGERIAALLAMGETVAAMCDQEADHEDIGGVAREAIAEDATAVDHAKQTPVRIAELKERQATARQRLADAQRQAGTGEKLAARAVVVASAELAKREAEVEIERLRSGYAAAGVEAKEKQAVVTDLRIKAQRIRDSIEAVKATADKAPRLESAEARIAELEPTVASLRDQIANLGEQRIAVETLQEVPKAPNLDLLRQELKRRQDTVTEGHRSIAGIEHQLEQAKASAVRQAELEQLEQQQLTEVADWTRVAADLGKDGLQALEIDAAGPELTALCNSLLHDCHGPRFTVRVETQRASADGKKMLEGCDVMVLDTVQGREAPGETFSGGERVILAESLALAITVLACRRSGMTDVSLVRDESGAALDPGNARVYVAMLRKAIEMVGARHCLLVSHLPEVQELCDHRIEVGA